MFKVFSVVTEAHNGQTQNPEKSVCLFAWPDPHVSPAAGSGDKQVKSGSSFSSLTLFHGFNLSVDSSAYSTTLYKYICPPQKCLTFK